MSKMLTVLLVVMLLGGCYVQRIGPNSEKVVLFPVFSVRKDKQFHSNGQISRFTDRGSALIIANWRKECQYDAEGTLVRQTDRSVLFPIWSIRKDMDPHRIRERGSILLVINYDDEKPRTVQ